MLTPHDIIVLNKTLNTLDVQKQLIDQQRELLLAYQHRISQQETIMNQQAKLIKQLEKIRRTEGKAAYVRSLN